MVIDGRLLAEKIKIKLKNEVEELGHLKIKMGVVLVGDNPISLRYVKRKKKFGEDIGIDVRVFQFKNNILEKDLILEIKKIITDVQGLIIQLPLPAQIDSEEVLKLIPKEKDIDCLSGKDCEVLSPVVGAIKEIFWENGVKDLKGKKAVIVGRGKLVGRPVFDWLQKEGAEAEMFGRGEGEKMLTALKFADIIVLGAGQAGMIKQEMIKDGTMLIDAATSEIDGKLAGDADPSCASKCKIFTPVPGGVGPLTLAMLFKNLIILAKKSY